MFVPRPVFESSWKTADIPFSGFLLQVKKYFMFCVLDFTANFRPYSCHISDMSVFELVLPVLSCCVVDTSVKLVCTFTLPKIWIKIWLKIGFNPVFFDSQALNSHDMHAAAKLLAPMIIIYHKNQFSNKSRQLQRIQDRHWKHLWKTHQSTSWTFIGWLFEES